MRFSALLLGLLFVPSSLIAQAIMPEVDTASVIRRGNHVEHVNGFQADEDTFGDVTAPPADDSHKWFISVYTISNCGPCAKLKADWETSEYLRAFGKPKDQAGSWAHLNFYNAEDETVNWRLKNLKVKSYPCIVIQPPRSRTYGDPATVVMQKSGYKTDKELAAQITAALKAYVKKIEAPKQSNISPVRTVGFGQVAGPPPFVVPSPNNPTPNTTPPNVIPAPLDPDVQPAPTPAPPDAPAPAPKTPESVMVNKCKSNSICVVVDADSIQAGTEKMAGRRKLLDFLRAKNPGVEPRVITTEQAKLEFPNLDTTEPQVIMTGLGGRLLSQIPQSIIDKLLEDQPELKAVGTVVRTIGAILPTVPQMVLMAGFGALLFYRKVRKGNATPTTPATPNAPAAPVTGDGHVLQKILEALQGKKPE